MITGSILTNIGAVEALNSISATSSQISSSESSLSSGLSINSPADDPAGYIEAQGFTSQISGETQSSSDMNTSISLLQTVQGAVGQQINIAQKLYSLAVESANGTENSNDRSGLQQVAEQLLGEISNISQTTQFNGKNLLDGSFNNVNLVTGATSNDDEKLSLSSTAASMLGIAGKNEDLYQSSYLASGVYATAKTRGVYVGHASSIYHTRSGFSSGSIDIQGSKGSATLNASKAMSGWQAAQAINSVSSKTGVTASASLSFGVNLGSGGNGRYQFSIEIAKSFSSYGSHYIQFWGSSANAIVGAINSRAGSTGLTASLGSGGALNLKQASGKNVTLYSNYAGNQPGDGDITTSSGKSIFAVPIQYYPTAFSTTPTLTSQNNFTVKNGSHIGLASSASKGSLAGMNLSTQKGAEHAMKVVTAAISQLEQIDANAGAMQDGLESLVSNMSQAVSNSTTALGVVQDANIPQTTENLTEEQVQAQSGVAALKSSSQLQQSFLSLLP